MKKLAVIIGIVSALSLAACQKKDDSGSVSPAAPPPAVTAPTSCPAGYVSTNGGPCVFGSTPVGGAASCQGSCPAGQVQTGRGCLPQNTCRTCYGYAETSYNGSAVQGWCFPSSVAGTAFSMKANAYSVDEQEEADQSVFTEEPALEVQQ